MQHLTRKTPTTPPKHSRRVPALWLIVGLLALAGMFAAACGVESGDRRPARSDEDQTGEFHRSPVAAFEQFRIDLEKTDAGCTADPADVSAEDNQRVSLAIQLKAEGEISAGSTGSTQFVGERDSVTYAIDGLTIGSSGGALGTGVTAIDLDLDSGTRLTYQFNVRGAGEFPILCDGEQVGTFSVTGG